ncbi:MAG: TetR family transcriptional regulator [Comamonadaceae bacterium]|nr:MAG: TetR family transcriptional regulator [Comamonadaceae bacterium]
MARVAGKDGRGAILDAAQKLFYEHGLEAISVEAIAAQAGVTKKALYYHFPSKHDLVLAYLDAVGEPVLAMLCGMVQRNAAPGVHPYACLLEGLRKWLKSGRFHGCIFMRAARSHPDDPKVLDVALRHKDTFLHWLESLAAQAGSRQPQQLAAAFRLLLDGILAAGNLYDTDTLMDTAQQTLSALLASDLTATTPPHKAKET